MSQSSMSFAGGIAEKYDSLLGPMFFDLYGADLAKRVAKANPQRVLETAAGTGLLTRQLRSALGADAELVVTDINDEMLGVARRRFAADPKISFAEFDACTLPYEDASFDALACQYGLMFFPEKVQALSEARRVLRDGGVFVTNVWDKPEANDLVRVIMSAVYEAVPQAQGMINTAPFDWNDMAEITKTYRAAGFSNPEIERVEFETPCVSAEAVMRAFLDGSPMTTDILAMDGVDREALQATVTEALSAEFGEPPQGAMMRALVITAHK
ncbi:MAG TPA: methyltransferase domain-containing protein [candidate division Zixibacteria bacterium]|nr:methyltransferase domain-containing protein [candidate division Zixibacteria bacterium]